ncbi:MAG TPA: ABC transporter permease, partial [Gemmatimonadales bacterium]|nr:ABC transporter permease [Gemmatimonadales bacterium]
MRRFLQRLRYYLTRTRRESEMNEELAHHLMLAAAEAESRGATREEARLEALRRVGAPGRISDDTRDEIRMPRFESIAQDIRYALRGLARHPMHTLAAVATLALGIGATTAIASVLASVLYTPLPFEKPERLVQIWEHNVPRDNKTNVVSPANFLDWRDRNSSFSEMAIYTFNGLTLIEDKPEAMDGMLVVPNMLHVLGLKPMLGRDFTSEDGAAGAPRSLLLTYQTWKRVFRGDSSVVGRAIKIREGEARVVGVLPPSASNVAGAGFGIGDGQDYWQAVQFTEASRVRRGRYTMVIARLKDGVTVEQAQADMKTIAAGLATEYPFNVGWSVNVVPMMEQVVGSSRAVLAMVAGAIALVLLIACANVASLTIARALGRRGELTLRTALGATQGRLVRQLTVEGVVLALMGGALGVLLGYLTIGALRSSAIQQIPRLQDLNLDSRVLALALLVTTGAGLLCGLLPGIGMRGKLSGQDLMGQAGRTTTSRGGNRLRAGLVVLQVAMSLLLLAGTGLMIRSLSRLLSVDVGFEPRQVMMAEVSLPSRDYPRERVNSFFSELAERARTIPGVEAVGLTNGLPLTPVQRGTSFYDADKPEPEAGSSPVADIRIADSGLFNAMRIPVIRGRSIDATDTPDGRITAVVNVTLARQMWGDADPLGRRIHVSWGGGGNGVVAEVVGVVGDVHLVSLDEKPRATVWFPMVQQTENSTHIALRVRGNPMSYAPLLARELNAMDPNAPLVEPRPMTDWTADSTASRRYPMLLLAILAGLALVLAAVGLYGVLAYFVGERTREIGVRRALGASKGSVVQMVMSHGARLVGIGLLIGGISA